MATNVSLNGNVYVIPAAGDDSWGPSLTDYFIAIPNAVLQRNGGNFIITADVNFGATYGLLSKYFSARSSAATNGLLRLGNTDTIEWRNFAGSGNLVLAVNPAGELIFQGVALTQGGITALTGDVTATGPGSAAATIAAGAVTDTKLATDAVTTIKIVANAVTNDKLAQVATAIFKGRTTAGTGNVEDLTAAQATALLQAFVGDSGSGGVKGLVPAPAAGDAAALKFLKADGTWAVPAGGGGGPTPVSFTIANNQTTPANVTSFSVNSSTNKGFSAEFWINRRRDNVSDGLQTNDINTAVSASAFDDTVWSTLVQPDQKVVCVGSFTEFDGNGCAGIVRLNSDGTEDTAFTANAGTGFTGNTAEKRAVLLSDGSIVVVGNFVDFNGVTVGYAVKIDSDGSINTAFNTALGTGFDAPTNQIAVDSSDNLAISGTFSNLNGSAVAPGLVKLSGLGVLDATFNTNVGTGVGVGSPEILALLFQSTGELIVAGSFTTFNSVAGVNRAVRLAANGTVDATLNLGTAFDAAVNTVSLQANGNIVFAGNFTTYNGGAAVKVARLSSTGTFDSAFYTNYINASSGLNNQVFASLVQSLDGKIVLGGSFTTYNTLTRNGMIRLNSNGTEDTAFYTSLGTGFNSINKVRSIASIFPQNLLLVGGGFNQVNSVSRVAFVCLGTSGIEVASQFVLRGDYRTNTGFWNIGGVTGEGDDVGVDFSMTSAGQLQYVSSNISGATTFNGGTYVLTVQ